VLDKVEYKFRLKVDKSEDRVVYDFFLVNIQQYSFVIEVKIINFSDYAQPFKLRISLIVNGKSWPDMLVIRITA